MQFSGVLFLKGNDMNNVRLLVAGLLAASALAFSPVAQAQMTGQWYAGVGFGQTKFKDACTGAADIGFSCDDTDTAARIFGGYKLNKNVAFEVGYADLGKAHGSGVLFGIPTTAEWKATAWDFVFVGILPLNPQFSLLGKVGVTSWSLDANITATGVGTATDSPTGTDTTYGVGVQWDINNQFGLRGEWQHYSNIGDANTTGQSDADVMSVSALMKF